MPVLIYDNKWGVEYHMDKVIEKWEEILNTVKSEYEISDVSFDTWIRPLEVFAIEGNTLYILVPSEQMALTYITKKYLAPLRVAIVEITQINYEIEFILPEHSSLATITVLHIPHRSLLRNPRGKHTTLFISTAGLALARHI